jgi:pyruvate/2-oxoglutarate dehydrogenase complex dihydrolipoamide dehydrogenase (E3) component
MAAPKRVAHTGFERMVLEDDPHDRALVANCHPPGWTNPTPAAKYNLVVVGAGTAGLVSAAGAAGLGARVALVERALTGGDCLNVGCVPSKGVIRAARAAFDARDAERYGVRGAGAEVDFAAAMERMRRLRAQISPVDSVARFAGLGVDVFLGSGRFVARDALEVDGARLRFDRAVIATGARASTPGVPGLEEAGYYTNETVFTLTELPRRLGVVGAGPIGCELAQAFARLGSAVTLVARGPQIMPREDRDAAAVVERQMRRDGVTVLLEANVTAAERRGDERVLTVAVGGRTETVACDAVLIGVGRTPNVEGLGLEAAEVRYTAEGVEVDERLRTSNRRIFASGDVCSRFKFTHAADAMSRMVLRNAFFFGRGRVDSLVMPWCTFTDPEVAHVGLYEEEARERGYRVATITQELAEVDRAILDGEEEGFARVHYDAKSGRILGGTIVARHAGEMIGELTIAIASGQTPARLSTTIHPYPTQAAALGRIGDAYMRGKLTPTVKRLFETWFAWRR